MSKSLSNFFKYFQLIDMFGLGTEFRINQKPRFQTTSGSLFTLVYVGFILFLFFSLGGDMIYLTNPQMSIAQVFEPSPSPTRVGRNDYSFIFGIQDALGNHFIDEEIYIPTLFYGNRNQTTKQDELIQIPLEICTLANMPDDPQRRAYFENIALSISDLYCISNDYQGDLWLQGAWDQDLYNFLHLYISPCNSSQSTCKPDDQIISALQTGFFGYYSFDNLFDLRDYKNPAKTVGLDYYIETTSSVKKIITRYVKTNHIINDDGWITASTSETEYFSFDSVRESFSINTGPDYLVDYVIRKSTYEPILTRTYMKIQNVLAVMSGFLQIIFIIISYLSRPFIKKEYYDTLTNNIYNFEVDENAKKKKKERNKKKSKSLEHIEKLKSFKTMVKSPGNDIELNELEAEKTSQVSIKKKKDDNKLANYFLKLKETPLNLSFCELFKGFFVSEPDLEVKKKQRNIGISNIFAQLDITYVLKKFAELDKLKMLLLNEDQYYLFEYLPKPVIMKTSKIHINYVRKSNASPVKGEKKASSFFHENDLVTKAKTVQKAYDNITKNENMSNLDRKLIESLDEDILQLLHGNRNVEGGTNFGNLLEEKKVEMIESSERESSISEKKDEIIIATTERNEGAKNVFQFPEIKK